LSFEKVIYLKKEVEINLLIFAVVLFIQRMAMPYVNYIFIPYLFILSLYFLKKLIALKDKNHIFKTIFKIYFPFLLISVIIFISFLFSTQRNILILKDILQIGVLLLFIIIELAEIRNIKEFNLFIHYFIVQIVISSGIISVLGLSKYLIALSGVNISFTKEFPLFSSSLSNDYNFYCLSNILGIISVIYLLAKRSSNKSLNILLQLMLFILSLNAFLSGSRRGFVFYLVFLFFVVLLNLNFLNKTGVKHFGTRIFLCLKIISILLLLFYISTYNSKSFFNFKRSDFNVNFINNTLFNLSYRYGSVFGLDMISVDQLVSIDYDSRYPYTRWGLRVHEEVYPLKGQNVEIVPGGSVGYKMDFTCNSDSWSGNAYSYTGISRLYKDDTLNLQGSTFNASVYCFVSNDFNGSWVAISAEGKEAFGNRKMNYDLSSRNTWQKLDIFFQSKKGIAPVVLFMAKEGVTDFNTLKGYVIFAFPVYKKVIKNEIKPEGATTYLKTDYYNKASFIEKDFLIGTFRRTKNYLFNKIAVSDTLPGDSFRIIKSDEFSVSRSERWRYGFFLFAREYSLRQKIFGNGFDYMEKFGKKFGESELDYPHNPFIDSFLYSGIIGGLAYLFFMFLVFYNYIKYFKYHTYFLLSFCVVFFFSFVSANTHFSIPIFTFLSLIPFFTKYIVEKERNLSINVE
jgi:hypothetical protein